MPWKWDKQEMDSLIRNYVEHNGSLSTAELNDPETDLPPYETLRNHYGGLKACAEELELDINFNASNPEYTRDEIIESIKNNSDGDIAPRFYEIGMSDTIQSTVRTLFGGHINAVFMAGKKPFAGWYKSGLDHRDEISADYIDLTRNNYWHNDPEDRWDTAQVGEGKYMNPTKDDFPFHDKFAANIEENLRLPNMRITNGYDQDIDIETQEEIMELVEEADRYLDIVDIIEGTEITESNVKKLLDPKSDISYGRWMSAGEEGPAVEVERNGKKVEARPENEFPDNAVAMLTSRI